MKKYILPILGLAALVACSKTEPVYEETGEIRFAPVTSLATKAEVKNAIDGTTYPPGEKFSVTAYWANQNAGSGFATDEGIVTYFSNRTFVKKEGASYWAGEEAAYWPKNGSLRFACYSPSTVANVAHELATDTYTITDYEQSNVTAETIDLMVAPTPASYDAKTGAENVAVKFEHALSWISFQVVSDETAAGYFTVKKIVVNAVNTKGSLSAVMSGTKSKTWTLSANKDDKKSYDVFFNKKVEATTTSNVAVSEVDGSETPVYIENVPGGTLVIPQPTTTVTITFDQQAEGEAVLEDQVITLPLTFIKKVMNGDQAEIVKAAEWEPGKHYIYTIKFAWEEDDQILINPSVEDWADVPADVDAL